MAKYRSSDISLALEIRDRGYVAFLDLNLRRIEDVDAARTGHKQTVKLGAPNAEERSHWDGKERIDMADVVVHTDGSISFETYRYVTNIALEDLELLVKLARAAKAGQLAPEKPPAGTDAGKDDEIPF